MEPNSKTKEFFLRDADRNPVALVVSEWLPGGAVLNVAVSMWNPRDVFDKRVAREVAYGRLQNHSTLFTRDYLAFFGSVKRGILDFVASKAGTKLYSTRTGKAARLWLDTEAQREHERKFKGTHLAAWGRKLTHKEWGVLKSRIQDVVRKFVTDGSEVMD